jgi:DNA-binding response OmpR family regulator
MTARPPRRILVVDDEASILFAMLEYLTAQGYGVDCAQGRDEAMALLDRHTYGVVVADLRLSVTEDEDGLDVVTYARGRCSSTRTVLLTAYGSPGTALKARERGADVVLHKPQPLRDIARIVEDLLDGGDRT